MRRPPLRRNPVETTRARVVAARNTRSATGDWARTMATKFSRSRHACHGHWDLSAGVWRVVTMGFMVGACSGSETGQSIPAADRPVPEVVPSRVTVPGRTDTIDVALLEYAIGIPGTLPAGELILTLSNQGFEDHNLRFFLIEADSVVWETASDVVAGETRVVELELEPGRYTVMCDVAGHDTRGMQITVNVEAFESE